MQYEYGVAPITYINGIPTYKAGEWEGKLSCKFHSYKRVIRPKDHGIIYNQFEAPLIPKRKILNPGHSPEFIFRPSCKMVNSEFSHDIKPKGLKYINFQTEPRKLMDEKRHFFPYKKQMENDYFEKIKKLPNSKIIRNETKLLMEENGYHKKNFFTFYNKDLKNIDFTRDKFGKLTWIETEPYDILIQRRNETVRDTLSQGNKTRNNDKKQRINSWDENINNFQKFNLTLPNINKNSTQVETN